MTSGRDTQISISSTTNKYQNSKTTHTNNIQRIETRQKSYKYKNQSVLDLEHVNLVKSKYEYIKSNKF